jgi:hypothetical protein
MEVEVADCGMVMAWLNREWDKIRWRKLALQLILRDDEKTFLGTKIGQIKK